MQPELGRTRQVLRSRLPELAARQIAHRLSEIHAVENIKDVCANFKREALEADRLRELSVHVGQSRADIRVPSQVSLASSGWCGKCRGRSKTLDEVTPAACRYRAGGWPIRHVVTIPVRVEIATPGF